MRWPGWNAIGRNLWDTRKNAPLFPPKVWGYGWSLNFAYPLIRTKPFWARVLVFLVCLAALVCLLWALTCIVVLLYYVVVPADNVIYLNPN